MLNLSFHLLVITEALKLEAAVPIRSPTLLGTKFKIANITQN